MNKKPSSSCIYWIKHKCYILVFMITLIVPEPVKGGVEENLGISVQSIEQQKVMVKGTIMDEDSQPIAGAVVTVKGTSSYGGTITDQNGLFRFEAPVGLTLQISFIGYVTEEKVVDFSNDWAIVMRKDVKIIDDVVIVGYGAQKKESVVGAISQVKSEELVNSGTTNITNALAGKIPGMLVFSNSGAPGEDDASFVIRGLSSWNGNKPLVMVDGIERTMTGMSPNEIATISVLKDASATAVYGAKGANGVILVTTKTGAIGKPKFNLNVEYSANSPLRIPKHIDAVTTVNMANVAYRNAKSFGSLFSDNVIRKYADQSNPLRYPDVNWSDIMLKDFSSSVNTDMNFSGGTDKLRYYLGVGYVHDGSIVRNVHEYGNTNFSYDRLNYRFNMDLDLSRTTIFSLKMGGNLNTTKRPASIGDSSGLFGVMYQAPSVSYPAFYPAWALDEYPDPDYPNEYGVRIGHNQGAYYANPYSYLMDPDFRSTMQNNLNTDLILNQKLDFITRGLSVSAKIGLSSQYSRISKEVSLNNPQWDIYWETVDAGGENPWVRTTTSNYVWINKPYAVTQNNSASGVNLISYLEGSASYKREFARNHNLTALALYNQRQFNASASFPKRNQSFVGRVTYGFKGKYLFESNLGITGSEQFSPSYRYGIFPSLAIGYYISKESFWKKALPWWSTMKIRYSNGRVGSDNSSANWLYYTAWTKIGNYLIEGAAANENARWESATKQDLGLEMGWIENKLSVNIDFYNEIRDDILMSPVVTAFVGIKYKDINAGSIKKHGMEIELDYRNTIKKEFSYHAGMMFGISENRITNYADIPFAPEYQKYVNTQYGALRTGTSLVDDRYFNSIDELHGYPIYTTGWENVVPGIYKFLDYYPDGIIDQSDLHVLKGSKYAPAVYSFNLGSGYKGFQFNILFTGTIGKYIEFKRAAMVPFLQNDLVVHKAYVDYWRPDNKNASAPNLLFNDQMYAWGGGTATYPGYDLAIPNFTWRKSDYLTIKEVLLSYKFKGIDLKNELGINSLSVSLSCNNLWTFTNLIENDPQTLSTMVNYYPSMRVMKLGVNIAF